MAFISVFPGFTPESGFGLTGNIGDGNSVTITGSGFGTKPNGAKPLFFIEFGDGVSALDANSRGSWTEDWHANASIQSDQVAPNRTNSFRYTFNQTGSSQGSVTATNFDMGGVADTYIFLRSRFNADGSQLFAANSVYNIKSMRMWATEAGSDHNWSGWRYGQIDETHGNPRHKVELMTGSLFPADRDVFGFRANEWITNEQEIHQGDVDTANSTWTLFRNAISETAFGSFISRTTPNNTNLARRLFFPQEQSVSDPGFQVYWWFDFFYADDSWARVMVSDEPTWDSATASPLVEYVRELQIPTAWADTSIACKLRRGTHSSFAGKRLYVIDSAGTAQKIGQFN